MANTSIAIASDHAGFELKTALIEALKATGRTVLDLGTNGPESVDYPDFADAVAKALADGKATRGVLVCGTGLGVSMAANRHRAIRCAHCRDTTDARLSRQHNDANVIAIGARTTGIEVAKDCLEMFLKTEFEGGRHARRVAKFA
jgi:ribose 5-phosphate isomerase B